MLITKNQLKKIILETIKEASSLANQYDGFLIFDNKSKKTLKSRYHKNIHNNFLIHGLIRKGEWNKFDNEEI